tara:strand:+ start:386 stop:520 length:135 start_codon:yes stop_codon:yes gene_type:complete
LSPKDKFIKMGITIGLIYGITKKIVGKYKKMRYRGVGFRIDVEG